MLLKFTKEDEEMEILLGSAVIAAICSGIVSYSISRHQGNLQYITGERKEWREKIRKNATRLHKADYKETLKILAELKVRINAFGNNGVSSSFKDDAHIWEVVKEIEEKEPSSGVLKLQQELLIQYLSLLLKNDWERSKKEVTGDIYKLLSRICYISFACVAILPYFFLEKAQPEFNNINAWVILVWFIIFGLIHWVFTQYVDSKCMGKVTGTVNKEPETDNRPKVSICYIIVIGETLFLIYLCKCFIEAVCKVIAGVQPVNRAIMWVAFVIYAVGLIMQGLMKLEGLNKMSMYNQAIYTLRKEYKKELEELKKSSKV